VTTSDASVSFRYYELRRRDGTLSVAARRDRENETAPGVKSKTARC